MCDFVDFFGTGLLYGCVQQAYRERNGHGLRLQILSNRSVQMNELILFRKAERE
jgi:hypothetical protein